MIFRINTQCLVVRFIAMLISCQDTTHRFRNWYKYTEQSYHSKTFTSKSLRNANINIRYLLCQLSNAILSCAWQGDVWHSIFVREIMNSTSRQLNSNNNFFGHDVCCPLHGLRTWFASFYVFCVIKQIHFSHIIQVHVTDTVTTTVLP